MTEENWKRIGTTHYWISDQGRVYMEPHRAIGSRGQKIDYSGRFVEPCFNGYGYLTVTIYFNSKPNTMRVHRLVAEAFVAGKDEEHCVVNHKDWNRANNTASNLEWVTYSYNSQYRRPKENSETVEV